jgi:hypothetical protein
MDTDRHTTVTNREKKGILIMRISLIAVCTVALAFSGVVAADEPIELSVVQMDQITAGSLLLPNGRVVQDNFDNPAPNENGYLGELSGLCDTATGAFCHPALTRRSDAAFASNNAPSVTGLGNDGPWTATVVSPVIDICGAPFPACP